VSKESPEVVVFGAGPIGGSVGGWIAEKHENIFFLDQGAVAEGMCTRGITLYEAGRRRETERNVRVKVISDIAERPDADIILVAVKNYSLDAVARTIREKVGDRAVIVGLQNGVENQTILPRHFSRVVYGVIGYNAWMDEPGVIGYQKRGPVVLGTPDNSLRPEAEAVARLFNQGLPAPVTDHLGDVVHSKLILNLANSVTTLVGHGVRPVSSVALLQRVLSNTLHEGVRIVRAAGYREHRIAGMPSWRLLRAGAVLPGPLTRPLFRRNLRKMVISSMAQDVIQRGSSQTELDTINGYFLELAGKHGVAAPYNRAVYKLCRREFARPGFQPLDVREVWEAVRAEMTNRT
jgi:2-dehydropantoate 2-reductase